MLRRLRWLVGQVVPRTHWTTYRTGGPNADERAEVCIWKMWLGRCYHVVRFTTV